MVVGFIVEEISNVYAKCVSHWSATYRSRSPGQGTCRVSTSRRSTMQGLVVVGLKVEKIWNVNVNCQSHWSAKYRSRSPGQCISQVRRSGRCVMQGMTVVVEMWLIRILWRKCRTSTLMLRRTDGRMDGWTEKGMPISRSQEVREMFHVRFDGCLAL